jgi:hypothetical protein
VVHATAVTDPAVRGGVVSMTHGRIGESPGALTSSHADVDPLTTMPRVAGLDVTVDPPDG